MSISSRTAIPAFITVWALAFAPTWLQWTHVWWTSPSYDFALVLAALTLWALLRGHARVPRPDARWVPPLAAVSIAWLFAWLAGIAAVQQVLVIAWGVLAVCALYGSGGARRLVPAIGWLVFASEIWEYAATPLQALVVKVVPPVMALLGLPSVVSGNRITIQAGTFIVEEGCSGVKYLISLLAFVAVLLYLQRFRLRHKVLLGGLAVTMALLANWFRVGTLIAVGQATQMRSDMMRDHATFGWIVFAVALVPLVLVARRYGEPADETGLETASAAVAPMGPRRLAWLAAGLVGPALAAAFWLAPAPATSLAAEPVPAGWTPGACAAGPAVGTPTFQELRSPAGSVRRGWIESAVPVRPESLELLNGALSPGQPRTYITHGQKGEIRGPDSRVIRFSEQEMLESGGLKKVRRFWFDVAGRSYSGSAVAKAALALKAPLGTRFMTIHAVESECSPSCDSARALLDQFMAAGS
ncbi:MAG TPA: exosortase [Steroidobacteraceae bacterium]|nr:exosortase [Steroidobacteraceae bacterium]